MGVLGANNDSVISGVLILRGTDFKPVVDVAPDWESYEYKQLHVVGPNANEEDKKFFEAALAWDLEVAGKKWADGKNVSRLFIASCRPLLSIVAVQVNALAEGAGCRRSLLTMTVTCALSSTCDIFSCRPLPYFAIDVEVLHCIPRRAG